MDRTTCAFAVIGIILLGVIVLMAIKTVPAEVGVPILTTALGGAIMYVFPAKANGNGNVARDGPVDAASVAPAGTVDTTPADPT